MKLSKITCHSKNIDTENVEVLKDDLCVHENVVPYCGKQCYFTVVLNSQTHNFFNIITNELHGL
jgi:hypothetical protein